jgi:hypothetical protein
MFIFWFGGIRDVQMNMWIHGKNLITNHVYNYVENASSMRAILIPKLLYLLLTIKNA